MATQWSNDIIVAELSDEPLLSDEVAGVFADLSSAGGKPSHVVLNFSGVSYVNSSNLGQLLKLRRQVVEAKKSLTLCCVGEEVLSIFRVTGLDKVFRFAPDPMTALAAIQIGNGR